LYAKDTIIVKFSIKKGLLDFVFDALHPVGLFFGIGGWVLTIQSLISMWFWMGYFFGKICEFSFRPSQDKLPEQPQSKVGRVIK